MGTICLALASFLNPFGFDILVYKLTQLTSDYWNTMFILYAFAALFFGASFLSFRKLKKHLGHIFLTIGLFLNPFGYDLVVYGINSLTHEYWLTMGIMYCLAITFFLLFAYLYKINPIKMFMHNLKLLYNKIKP